VTNRWHAAGAQFFEIPGDRAMRSMVSTQNPTLVLVVLT
jgi:hypothetical protein